MAEAYKQVLTVAMSFMSLFQYRIIVAMVRFMVTGNRLKLIYANNVLRISVMVCSVLLKKRMNLLMTIKVVKRASLNKKK
jgi:hypothetical protein